MALRSIKLILCSTFTFSPEIDFDDKLFEQHGEELEISAGAEEDIVLGFIWLMHVL